MQSVAEIMDCDKPFEVKDSDCFFGSLWCLVPARYLVNFNEYLLIAVFPVL